MYATSETVFWHSFYHLSHGIIYLFQSFSFQNYLVNTVKHWNNRKIRRRQTLRYLDASYYFVLLISII